MAEVSAAIRHARLNGLVSHVGDDSTPEEKAIWHLTVALLDIDDRRPEGERLAKLIDGAFEAASDVLRDGDERRDRYREALEDAAAYLRLGYTWIADADRHSKMRAAHQRAADALSRNDRTEDA